MEVPRTSLLMILVAVASLCFLDVKAWHGQTYCGGNAAPRCQLQYIDCPDECPSEMSANSRNKICWVDCFKPLCMAECRRIKPSCEISLVSDPDFQINGRFTGHRPVGRSRETSHGFKLLDFSLTPTNSPLRPPKPLLETTTSTISSLLSMTKIWLSSNKLHSLGTHPITTSRLRGWHENVIVTIKDKAVIMVNVVPVTKEDDRFHNYKLPIDDCFAHLEVQFKFINLSPKVDGILGRTIQVHKSIPKLNLLKTMYMEDWVRSYLKYNRSMIDSYL